MAITRIRERPSEFHVLDDADLDAVTGGSIIDVAIDLWHAVTTITSPRDPASGLPTGQRMHKPLT